ncbi:hypothetical protein QR98_0058390 [Sarcoptes scabiei]|uniref:Uncharacterized protein n=1 Tax=Sarcoptes scabiei TaxID=52283 RepID=A0A132A8S2_SARSC|nr:hypothetical protein QR98_0058390 [Sarcoptes scabiei]
MHGLNKEAIVYGLPRIDTTKTIINEICPAFLKPVKCEITPYRTLTGMCNNLEYPSWGSARSAMLRYMPPDYADGLSDPRTAKSGQPLPPPRVVSFMIHQDENDYDREVTYLVIAWGQMVDHDLTFASMPKGQWKRFDLIIPFFFVPTVRTSFENDFKSNSHFAFFF